MGVVDRQARAVVGGEAHAHHDLLQRRLAQLGDHGRGQRCVAVGVEREEHRVVVAAAGQALLGVEQLLLVVVGAGGQARDAARGVGVVALHAAQHQRAELVGRARLVGHAEAGLVAVGVDLGAADLHAAGGKALGREAAQRGGLGVVPRALREGLAGAQRPAGADGVALRFGAGVVGDLAGVADLHGRHFRSLAGCHGDDDLARGLGAVGCFVEFERERGREVAQRAQQFARIGLGRDHEARDLGHAQVVELAVALDFEVAREVVALGFGAAHVDGEGVAPAVGLGLVVVLGGVAVGVAAAHHARGGRARVRRLFFRQQAAALQKQDAGKKQSRPQRRRKNGCHPDHGGILTAPVWRLPPTCAGPRVTWTACASPLRGRAA
ncbi:hypothetical protein D3C72_1129930 [compost metagenome]